jgi:hypothetical protein
MADRHPGTVYAQKAPQISRVCTNVVSKTVGIGPIFDRTTYPTNLAASLGRIEPHLH